MKRYFLILLCLGYQNIQAADDNNEWEYLPSDTNEQLDLEAFTLAVQPPSQPLSFNLELDLELTQPPFPLEEGTNQQLSELLLVSDQPSFNFAESLVQSPFSLEASALDLSQTVVANPPIPGQHTCYICNKFYKYLGALNNHIKKIHVDEQNKCHICNKLCDGPSDLIKHMRMHTGERPYGCKSCSKSFTTSSSLNTHMRMHTYERPYKCTHCDAAFAQSGNLKRHERVHTGEKPYQCTHCDAAFADQSHLTKHIRVHHPDKKPYKCTHCDAAFAQSSHLKEHKKVHENN